MKTSWFGLGCLIFLVAAPCFGADIGMVTLVDGKPKVLHGTAWFNLSEGVRVRDGDTLDVPDKGQLQLELTDGGAVSVVGPGALYAASLTPRDAKQASLAERQNRTQREPKQRPEDTLPAPAASPSSRQRVHRRCLLPRCRAISWIHCPGARQNSLPPGRTRPQTATRHFPRRNRG